MRIAIITDSLRTGGAEGQAVLTAGELRRRGHHAELISYHPGNDFSEYIRTRGIRWVRIEAGGLLRIGRIRALAAHLRDGRFDIAHCFGAFPSITGSLAAALVGVPPVGACRVEYRESASLRIAHKTVDRFVARWVVNSQGIADTFMRATGIQPDKCVVVYNGIDLETFRSSLGPAQAKERIGVDPGDNVVSIIAQLRPQKNHPLFLELASRILSSRSDVRFLVVGDGTLRPSLEDRARSLGIADRVLFLGNRGDVADILSATDVSVLTSHYEGLANALVESMAMKVPVVTTDYLGADEIVTDGRDGFIVARGDGAALADKVCSLLDNPELCQSMGRCGRQAVETRFSAQAMCRNLLSVYESCLESVGRRPTAPLESTT